MMEQGEKGVKEEKKPVFEQRLGAIRLSIWENRDKNGNVFHNIKIFRRYRVSNDEWRNTDTYTGLADLVLLSEAVQMAKQWLHHNGLVWQGRDR